MTSRLAVLSTLAASPSQARATLRRSSLPRLAYFSLRGFLRLLLRQGYSLVFSRRLPSGLQAEDCDVFFSSHFLGLVFLSGLPCFSLCLRRRWLARASHFLGF